MDPIHFAFETKAQSGSLHVVNRGTTIIIDMMKTYKATLVKDHVLWTAEVPTGSDPVDVYITLLDSPSQEQAGTGGSAMADALQKIADLGGPQFISDAVTWQRETRADRVLPGREE
jgi:hypothetical protein